MNNKKRELLESVSNDIQEMIHTIQDLEDDTIRWNPSPQEWSIMQIVSHVSEAIPYWVKLTKKILKDPTTKMERTYFSQSRLNAISEESIQSMTTEEAVSSLNKLPILVEQLLESLTDEEFQDDAVQFILHIEIAEHIDGHINQMKRNLSNREKYKAKLKFEFLN